MLEKREEDGTAAGYHSSTFLVIFALRAIGYEQNHPEIQALLHAVRKSLFVDPETGYSHQQTCDAHVWNTAEGIAVKQHDSSVVGGSQSHSIFGVETTSYCR